jgi:transcriptional regulator with XRE-family HTH domain
MLDRRERGHYRPKTIYSKEYEIFLRLLREARVKSGLTQEQIAERMKQDQAMISRCFTGSRRVDIVELRAFLTAMEVPFADFVLALDQEWQGIWEVPPGEGTESSSGESDR